MESKDARDGTAFDDVPLVRQYSRITPDHAEMTSRFTRNVRLSNPHMDTVTESVLAIVLAQEGAVVIPHTDLLSSTPPVAAALDVALEVAEVFLSKSNV